MPSQPETLATTDAVRAVVDFRTLPWIRPLVHAYTHDYGSVGSLFAGDPSTTSAWRETIGRVQASERSREALAKLLSGQLDARQAPPEAHAAAARLTDPASVAVVTGQQAGLFGGPVYSLLKAITTLQLARQTETTYGVPTVPVFWVESEDHDWAEVQTTRLLDRDMTVQTITAADPPGAGTQPISQLVLDDRITATIDAAAASLAPTEFTDDLLAALRRCYRPGVDVGTACATWFDHLLGRHGLVVFDASDAAAKPMVGRIFAHVLEHSARVRQLLRDAGARLQALGHDPQLVVADDHVPLFYLDESGRQSIRDAGDTLTIGDASHTPADLAHLATEHPERFSPKVALRPVVQDQVFPTICYVAGPSELAYQAQLGSLYADCGVARPLLYSRASATLADSASLRFLDRHNLTLDALARPGDDLLTELQARLLPPDVETTLTDTARLIDERAAVMQAAVTAVDKTLAGTVDTTRGRMQDTLKTLHTKILQAAKRNDDTLRRQFTRSQALLFPDRHPQERTLGLIFFINRYGLALTDRLLDALPVETGAHYVVTP